MKSAIKNICNIADTTLKQYGYDPSRLGYSKEEIDEMKKFIETINTKEDFARMQIEIDIMRVVDDYSKEG